MNFLIVNNQIVTWSNSEFAEIEVPYPAFIINGVVFPKDSVAGYQVVQADPPSGRDPSECEWIDGEVVLKEEIRVAEIKQQIVDIENANPISQRALREQALIIAKIIEQLTGDPPDSVGFVKVAQVDAEISTLREQL